MSLTLLLDLDDTLIGNSMQTFLPAYLQALSKQLGTVTDAKIMIKELLAATQLMVEKRQPALSLEQTFDRAFYKGIGIPKDELQDQIDDFYSRVFPGLQSLTNSKPEAVELIEYAFQQDYQVVIATNPLFPAAAIHQRLRWAGIPLEKYPYHLVTTYSSFHFAKPSPAYYAEILAQLGWPNQPAVMVGNELNDDIVPASQLGLPCYWLQEGAPQPLPEVAHPLSAVGSFDGILHWLKRVAEEKPQFNPVEREALLAVLQSTPAALDTLTNRLDLSRWSVRPESGEWNLTEIICHLRDVDREVNLPRLKRVIDEENPHLAGQNTDPWAEERDYASQNGPAALEAFILTRSEMLELLDKLTPSEWERKAQHTIFGPTTLRELVSFIATHDRTHIQQIVKTIGLAKSA